MDKRHFTSFYETYVERIYKFVFYRVNYNRALAEDLTHDIFLKVFEVFDRYDPTISHVSWLYTIARNHLINDHAKRRHGVDLDDVDGTLIASEDARVLFTTRHDELKLLDTITKLSSEDAKLVRMKYLEGWTFDDLALIFEKTAGALRVQATRALKKVKSLMRNPNA